MRTLLALLIFFLLCGASWGCFGPKLYLGIDCDPSSEVLYEIVSLYLKEKTGVETVRVDLDGRDPMVDLDDEKIDMTITPTTSTNVIPLITLPPRVALYSGDRPYRDIQFTTVIPALKKLASLISGDDFGRIVADIDSGMSPAAASRKLLMTKGWI